MKTETIRIEGMSCMHCSASVEGALLALPGVVSVTVSLEDKTVCVTYDEGSVTTEKMKTVISELGFEAV